MHTPVRSLASLATSSGLVRFVAPAALASLVATMTPGCSKTSSPDPKASQAAPVITTTPEATDAGEAHDAGHAATGSTGLASEDGGAANVNDDATTVTTTSATPPAEALAADAKAANSFTLKAFLAAQKGAKGNLMLSGTSLRHALGVAYLGARGQTASELGKVLGLPSEPKVFAEVAKGENAAWEKAKGTGDKSAKLVVVDRLWTDKTFTLAPDFTKLVATIGAGVEPVDFQTAPEAARGTINKWVSTKTNEKIPELLPKTSVDARTRAVITNAIYFKGQWATPFAHHATQDGTFTTDAGGAITTKMMHATETFAFAETATEKVLELRYQASDLAMTVVLPKTADGLAKLEQGLTPSAFDAWTKTARGRVEVTLPKFTFAWGGSMNKTLQALGIQTAFSRAADFSGMTTGKNQESLEISEVVHKTWVAVDEAGTEAAAATGIMLRTTAMPMGPIAEFKADHPFLFFIRDVKSGRILFVGRVVDPKAS